MFVCAGFGTWRWFNILFLNCFIYEGLVKKWPLVIINSDTPQEALAFLSRQLPHLAQPLPPEITRFALELHAASRYVINRPPTWCPARERDRSRAAPFRILPGLPTASYSP